MATNALGRHVALVGFMGSGKTTLGSQVAERIGRPFLDLDRELERSLRRSVPELFAERGEAEFRVLEAEATHDTLTNHRPAVVALGGGAIESERIRRALEEHALTVLVDVEPDEAWERVRGGDRPLAQEEDRFRALYERRRALYEEAADARARDVDGVVLAAGGVEIARGGLGRLGELVPGDEPVALAADATVASLHGETAVHALGHRLASMHEFAPGEAAKTFAECERVWRELRIERDEVLVGLGGGAATDAAGFVAATFLRGIAWVSVPTSLVGQVDAGIGGKTGVNLPEGKNLAGAFHWPVRTVIDPDVLATLPEAERLNGLAEVVKTGLLAGEELWTLPDEEMIRACAAFKTGICLRDPEDRGPRAMLNLGHTFAHALETASDYQVPHGRAVALGLLAALRLSELPTGVVEELLEPEPVAVDRDRAWAALLRDKKGIEGAPRLVLLEAPGRPRVGVELPAGTVREALDALIAK